MSETYTRKVEGREDFETKDVFLVSALMAIGIRPKGRELARIITPEHSSGRAYQYTLEPVSDCGKYRTGAMVKAWAKGLEWIEKNPDHPFAYAMAAIQNYRNNLEALEDGEEYCLLKAGASVALIPMNASLEMEEKLLGNF